MVRVKICEKRLEKQFYTITLLRNHLLNLYNTLQSENMKLKRRLGFYENSTSQTHYYTNNSKKRQQARKTNDDTPAKRGAKKGHTDTSHKRKPTATIIL